METTARKAYYFVFPRFDVNHLIEITVIIGTLAAGAAIFGNAFIIILIRDVFFCNSKEESMKNAKWIILIIACVAVFLSCRSNAVRYELMQESNQIVSIQIAEGISEKDVGEGQYNKIKVIVSIPQEKWDLFLADFSKVQCSRFRNDPCQSLEGIIFYITYKNGAIELIGDCAAFYHWIDGEARGDFRPYYFNKEEFNALIAQYSEN